MKLASIALLLLLLCVMPITAQKAMVQVKKTQVEYYECEGKCRAVVDLPRKTIRLWRGSLLKLGDNIYRTTIKVVKRGSKFTVKVPVIKGTKTETKMLAASFLKPGTATSNQWPLVDTKKPVEPTKETKDPKDMLPRPRKVVAANFMYPRSGYKSLPYTYAASYMPQGQVQALRSFNLPQRAAAPEGQVINVVVTGESPFMPLLPGDQPAFEQRVVMVPKPKATPSPQPNALPKKREPIDELQAAEWEKRFPDKEWTKQTLQYLQGYPRDDIDREQVIKVCPTKDDQAPIIYADRDDKEGFKSTPELCLKVLNIALARKKAAPPQIANVGRDHEEVKTP